MAATLVWFSGCESGGPVPNDNTGAGNEFTNGFSKGGTVSPSVVTTPVRTGTYALFTPHDGTARARCTSLAATTFLRCYFRPTGSPAVTVPIIGVGSSVLTPKFFIFLNVDRTLGWAFGTGVTTPSRSGTGQATVNAWNLLEVKFVRDVAVGGVEVFLNGVLQFTDLVTATTTGTSASSMSYIFGNDVNQPGTNQSGIDLYWDDMAVTTGAYIGPGGCRAFQGKSGAPTYNAWGKTGAADAFGCWSQTPFDATKFCSDSVVADRQTMLLDDAAVSAAIGTTDVINGAFVNCVAKIVTSGTFKITRRVGGVDTDSANKALSTTDTWEPNPVNGDTTDIFVPTRAQLTAGTTEIGAVANSTNVATVEDMWLMVDFTPTPPPPLLRDEAFPVEWRQTLARLESIPLEWKGPIVLLRDELVPVEWRQTLARLEGLPVEWLSRGEFLSRTESLPVEWTGQPSGTLLLIWKVLNKYSTLLLLQWTVVSGALNQSLQLQWNVKNRLPALTLRWNVIPLGLVPPQGGQSTVGLPPAVSTQDIQQPTSIQEKTP